MYWSAVFVFVLGPMSVLTLPTTTEASTDPPAVTNPTAPSVPLPPGELELILDTLLTQVDRHNTWLETLQEDVYSLGDSVELHSLDLQKLKKKFHKIHKGKKSSKHSSEESIESDENLIDSLSFDDLSWDESESESSQDSSNAINDEEDLELFKEKENEFIEKYRTNGDNRGRGQGGHPQGRKWRDNEETEEEEETERQGNNGRRGGHSEGSKQRDSDHEETEETEEERETERHGNNGQHNNRGWGWNWGGHAKGRKWRDSEETEEETERNGNNGWHHNRGRGSYRREDVDNTEEHSSSHGSDESHDHS